MRIRAGANAWRKVEWVMGDGRMSCLPKGNVLSSSFLSAHEESWELRADKRIMDNIKALLPYSTCKYYTINWNVVWR